MFTQSKISTFAVLITGVLFLSPRMGIFGLAWGVVLGACLHLVVQIPGLLSLGGRFFRGFGLGIPEVRQVGRLMAPRLLGQAVVQVNFLVSTILASGMPEGSLAAITFLTSQWMLNRVNFRRQSR